MIPMIDRNYLFHGIGMMEAMQLLEIEKAAEQRNVNNKTRSCMKPSSGGAK